MTLLRRTLIAASAMLALAPAAAHAQTSHGADARSGSEPVTRAQAAPEGRVRAAGGLVVRGLPTASSARRGTLERGTVVPLTCKVTGSVVRRGNDQDGRADNLWYRLPGAGSEWVSALYVRRTGGPVPYCGDGRTHRARVTTRLLLPREAPTTRASSHGGLARGTTVRVNCRLRGTEVRGNDVWYNLPQGLWVSARYVADVGQTPGWCTA